MQKNNYSGALILLFLLIIAMQAIKSGIAKQWPFLIYKNYWLAFGVQMNFWIIIGITSVFILFFGAWLIKSLSDSKRAYLALHDPTRADQTSCNQRRSGLALRLGLIFVLSGAISNLVDRLRFGAVIDYFKISTSWFGNGYFNVDDILICVGMIIIIFSMRDGRRQV